MIVPSPVISVEALHHLRDSGAACTILDASWYLPSAGRDVQREFSECHIPGAVLCGPDTVSDSASSLPHMLPSAQAAGEAFGKCGVRNVIPVIIYDSAGLFSAARIWWMLRGFGHTQVSVLAGGLPAWKNAGYACASGESAHRHGAFTASAFNPSVIVDAHQVAMAMETGSAQLVDARSAARFLGLEKEPRPGVRPGHIPGSINLPYRALLDARGEALLPASDLQRVFAEAGVEMSKPVYVSCGSGVTACILSLALAVLNKPDVAVYDGSWAEWGSDPARPVVLTA